MVLYKMFGLIKKLVILVLLAISASPYCLLLKNQKRAIRKVVVDNDYITFPYKIKVDECVGSCNDVENPYFKVCLPDVVKNIKSLGLISDQTMFKNISFYQSFKCGCLLDEKVCNNKQKWNKDKCICECLIKEKCSGNSFLNVINCNCEMKNMAALIEEEEECDVEADEFNEVSENKTVTLIKKIENCKSFVTSSILFVCVSVILTGIMIYFCLKSKNNSVLPY